MGEDRRENGLQRLCRSSHHEGQDPNDPGQPDQHCRRPDAIDFPRLQPR